MSYGERSWVVRGRIVSHKLRGLTGLRVVAVDKNVGREVVLGEGTSGERGTYEIHYSTAWLKKENPDLQVLVLDDNGESLAVSAIRYNNGPVESGLDIVIPANKLPQPPEYHQLIGELGVHLDTQDEPQLKKRLAALKEDDRQQDITYLANKTGWDARMVAITSLASQFSERSGIEPEFYYALFRAGVPANETVLSQMASETVQQAWELSVEQQILPDELKAKIPESLERFKAYSVGRLLETPAQIGVSSFKELLGDVLSNAANQQRFAQLYYEQRGDLNGFWESVRGEFGAEVADRLQLDGKLGFLTVNNAPLIQRLHAQNGALRTPLDLVQHGLYQSKVWEQLLGDDMAIPAEIPGEKPEEKKANYAAFMASQLRLSYPTAVVAEMVKADTIPLHAEPLIVTAVTQFLDEHQGKFELGIHPVEQYLRKNDIALDGAVLAQVKTLQRVYQISPTDESMGKLLKHNLDSAYMVVRYDEQTFVSAFKDELGGEAMARLIYAKAHQVHHAVLNITTAYVLEKSALPLYAIENLTALNGTETVAMASTAEDSGVLTYSTLEGIFGEMDYCACEHCRSWLSPAAYLVDLLQFLDPPTHEKDNPLDVLLGRRPDIQHVKLTCENTNTVLPYIDLVNEILEHYVINGSLATFSGHNIEEGVTTEELLANPQFVNDAAYTELRNNVFPLPLPFHQPLEAVRRYFEHFDVPLHAVMERLRTKDSLERADGVADPAYGWRDILMERLQLSRPESAVFTDSGTPLQKLYGEDPGGVSEAQLIDRLSNAKMFARRLNFTYEELIDITRTQFINPHSHLIPKLEKLGINFAAIQAFIDGTLSEAAFEALLPDDLDVAPYGGDVKQWLRDNEARIMGLIVLSDPTGSEDICSFDTMELRYALPDIDNNKLKPVEFLKLLRFIRLWRKLDWSIEQTDKAIAALYLADQYPTPADDADTASTKLDAGFQILILRLAHLQTVIEHLKLTAKRELTALLACWSPIDTHGFRSLYRQMFVNPTILALDPVFNEDGYGGYLAEKKDYQAEAEPPKLFSHVEALRAAFNLSQEEFDLILQELGFGINTVLDLVNVSAIFRHGFLARRLHLSVREFLALKALSGLDPFLPLDIAQPPDPAQPLGAVRPAAIRFIELVQQIKASPFKVSQLLYFLRHEDLSGKASPSQESVLAFARLLRNDLSRIDRENVVQDDPNGEVARAKMALVYGGEATDIFFGLLNNTSPFSITYIHGQPSLGSDILAVTNRIAYDDFQKQLSFRGVMTVTEKADLAGAASATADFQTAVQALFDAGQEAFAAFFEHYPDLKGLYENFVDSNDPLEDKMSALLADFLPDLLARLKRHQVRQTVSAQVGADLPMMTLLLETASLLHAIGRPAQPAINDFLALETQGLSTDIFFADDVVGDVDQPDISVSTIDYREGGFALPANPAGGNATISGVWRGFLEAPDNGFYNVYAEVDTGAEISLMLAGQPVTLSLDDGVWHNQDAIELRAGLLYSVQLTVKKVKDRLVLKWEHKGMGRAPIPAEQLYPALPLERFTTVYLRLLKVLAIADALMLSSAELEHFAAHDDYFVNGEGWLNALPVAPLSDGATAQALLRNVVALLQYRALKETWKIRDERLLELLQDPAVIDVDGVLLLERITGWQETDRTALCDHYGLTTADLAHLQHFVRVHEALAVVKKLSIRAATLLDIATNEPTADRLRNLQGALRARYDDTPRINTSPPTNDTWPAKGAWPTNRDWLKLIQPINNELRSLQRNALVASVLHKLQQDDATKHIDTPDKLFEYFLIDVEMDPCMKTSRIRQALSSVQLFIQRCLLNLEPQVASSAIKANQWEWMKRYRVWEANRKVFLWPENWIEPELRDNKSPFFKDLESELLQSDITDDAAATALGHYLERLNEVAKLEICGMYYAESEINNEADDIVHVIARTAGTRRTYYYRRQEGSTAWTAWEKVDLNIEDNPVLPVVWKGRLFLFWVSVLQEALTSSSDMGSDTALNITNLKPSELKRIAGEAKTRITITLYWSEYYNSKWQSPRTSDVNKPIEFNEFELNRFDRSKLTLTSSYGNNVFLGDAGVLYIDIGYQLFDPSDPYLKPYYTPDQYFSDHFKFFNTHSIPIRQKEEVQGKQIQGMQSIGYYKNSVQGRLLRDENGNLLVDYFDIDRLHVTEALLFSQEILRTGQPYQVIDPRHYYQHDSTLILGNAEFATDFTILPYIRNLFAAPFFFQDSRHVFFVRPSRREITTLMHVMHADFGFTLGTVNANRSYLPIPLKELGDLKHMEKSIVLDVLVKPGTGSQNLGATFTDAGTHVNRLIATNTPIRYGDRLIGPNDSIVPMGLK